MPRGFWKALRNSNNAQKWPNSLASVFPADQGRVGETVQGSVSDLREGEVRGRAPPDHKAPHPLQRRQQFQGRIWDLEFFFKILKKFRIV